jgi:hypothetical protein
VTAHVARPILQRRNNGHRMHRNIGLGGNFLNRRDRIVHALRLISPQRIGWHPTKSSRRVLAGWERHIDARDTNLDVRLFHNSFPDQRGLDDG